MIRYQTLRPYCGPMSVMDTTPMRCPPVHNRRAGDFPLDEVSRRFIGRHLLSHRYDVRVISALTFRVLLIAQFSGFRLLGWRASGPPHISSRGWQPTMCYPLRVHHWCGITPAASIRPLRVQPAMEAKLTDHV
jgi:hypothetical protein